MRADANQMTLAGLNLIAQAMSIFDADLRLVVGNKQLQRMFGLPRPLVRPGARFEDVIAYLAASGDYGPIEDVDAFVAERVRTARAFEPHYMERTRPNGQVISVEGAPLPQGGWVTVYTDITPVKRQEALLRTRASELSEEVIRRSEALAASNRALAATNAALEEAKRQLTESEARIRQTTRMMPAHIAHLDASERYVFSNLRLADILPGRPSDIEGRTARDVMGEAAYARIKPHLTQAYDGKPALQEFTDEATGRRIRAAFTPDGEGGVYVMSTDITAETQARNAVQQTARREMGARLTSGLAHDFANLLTIILGHQAKLAALPGLPDGAGGLLDGIRQAADRGGALLDTIANMTRARSYRPSAVDLAAVLDGLATLAGPALPETMTIRTEACLPAHPVLVDEAALQEALLNLVLNARDACAPLGRIEITARAVSDTWLEINVTDDGPGFSPEALRQGMQPFYTTKGAGGTGLGLASVYDMAKGAGGELRLFNRAEGGAHVRLRLPLRYAPDAARGVTLLVEDDDDLRAGIRDMLLDLGCAVIEAESVDEALALMADLPEISLVLSDIRLKGTATGVDLADSVVGRLPVVLMTSLPPTDPLAQAARARTTVLQKPVTRDVLRTIFGTREVA